MPDAMEIIASTEDPDGRQVVVLARIWTGKILRDHPELAQHLGDVVATVERPDHVSADPRDERLRF